MMSAMKKISQDKGARENYKAAILLGIKHSLYDKWTFEQT